MTADTECRSDRGQRRRGRPAVHRGGADPHHQRAVAIAADARMTGAGRNPDRDPHDPSVHPRRGRSGTPLAAVDLPGPVGPPGGVQGDRAGPERRAPGGPADLPPVCCCRILIIPINPSPEAPGRGYRGRVLAPPDDLPDAVLASALGHGWGIAVASVEYRAVGWGSHHWDVADTAGARWFVTADDLEEKRLWEDGPAAAQFGRLRAALT